MVVVWGGGGVQASEILIGLWLRSLKQPECFAHVDEWAKALEARPPVANDNTPKPIHAAKQRALALLDATCEVCAKSCPRSTLRLPALQRNAARPA